MPAPNAVGNVAGTIIVIISNAFIILSLNGIPYEPLIIIVKLAYIKPIAANTNK